MSVPANIRKYRLQRQWTQAELAARVGKRRVTITRYELGSVDLPVSVLQELARAQARTFVKGGSSRPRSMWEMEVRER